MRVGSFVFSTAFFLAAGLGLDTGAIKAGAAAVMASLGILFMVDDLCRAIREGKR